MTTGRWSGLMITLMHDEFKTSVEAAFRIIDNLTAKGYTFVTVDELMVD